MISSGAWYRDGINVSNGYSNLTSKGPEAEPISRHNDAIMITPCVAQIQNKTKWPVDIHSI
jgi:hypothetical protein